MRLQKPLFAVLVQGPSMVPTLRHGDALLVRRGGRAIRPGDVVVARFRARPDLLVVKRAVRAAGRRLVGTRRQRPGHRRLPGVRSGRRHRPCRAALLAPTRPVGLPSVKAATHRRLAAALPGDPRIARRSAQTSRPGRLAHRRRPDASWSPPVAVLHARPCPMPCPAGSIPSSSCTAAARWRSPRPCRWPAATTCRWRTPRASPGSARRSPPTRPARRLHLDRQHGRRRHRRFRRARARQHRPARRDAGDGGQGRAVQAVRRGRRGADLPGHPGRRRDRRASSPRWRRRSAGSTSRTSARRAASRSSGGSTRRSTSRSSTTTSTARRSSCSPPCATRSPCSDAGSPTCAWWSAAPARPGSRSPGC